MFFISAKTCRQWFLEGGLQHQQSADGRLVSRLPELFCCSESDCLKTHVVNALDKHKVQHQTFFLKNTVVCSMHETGQKRKYVIAAAVSFSLDFQ